MARCYVGKCKGCGAIIAACVDDPKHAQDVAKFCSDQIKRGRLLEPAESAQIRDHWGDCLCKPAPTQPADEPERGKEQL